MIDELRSRKLLGPFRGENGGRRGELVRALVGLSRIGMEIPEVTEADINPLLVVRTGVWRRFDALLVLGERPVGASRSPPIDPVAIAKLLPRLHRPRRRFGALGKWGTGFFCNVVAGDSMARSTW